MISLRDLQARCHRAFLHDDVEALLPWIAGDRETALAGVNVYRNNALETFRKTLAACYPIVLSLVGDACFRTLARDYMRAFPSTSGDLNGFGGRFDKLLEQQYAGTRFDYLPDVARLEWACEQVLVAREVPSLALAELAAVPADRHGDLCFALSPAAKVVASRYPILSLQRLHEGGWRDGLDLEAGSERALVVRCAGRVELHALDEAHFAFVSSVEHGHSLTRAADGALAMDPYFDPGAALIRLARLKVLVGFALSPNECFHPEQIERSSPCLP